ncbi:MAG: DnaJ domain-containing protein [Treponema sp.]|nr:DnaJ domain-containing protein [Treponema sp.]
MTSRDAHSILELKEGATFEEIKKSYRRLALKYHPDRNRESKEAEEKFKQINDAYEYLEDYQTRKDDALHTTSAPPTQDDTFAYHHNYHERYKRGHFGEYKFKKRA